MPPPHAAKDAPRAAGLSGVFSVLPTPFDAAGNVDVASLRRVVDLFVGAGVDGLTALGVTSEAARLQERERALVLESVIEQAAGRVPVVAGTSADGRRSCLELSRQAVAAGVYGVMVSPPRLPKLDSDAVVEHYRALADVVTAEIVVQDYPPACGFGMEASLLVRIASEVPRARTIKLEDPPTPLKVARIRERAAGVELRVLGGLGGVFLLEELISGADGVMTGFAYPEMLIAVVREFRAGRAERAAELFYGYVPLMRFEFQEGIGMAIRKELLRRRGALAHAGVRAPGARPDAATLSALDSLLAWLGKSREAPWIST
jgi:4-hydroxy-tetrahydrodipicolinate synthase